MIFNFSRKPKFTTRVSMNEQVLPVIRETKLLGTVISDDLKWDKNTAEIVRKGNARLLLLRRAREYTNSRADLKTIYIAFIRSLLEQSSSIWHSSLTQENTTDIERVQKSALRIIQREKFIDYETSLRELDLETLQERRKKLALKFAINCKSNEKTKHLFPPKEKKHKMVKRHEEKYKIKYAKKKRLKISSVPYMQALLNEYENTKKQDTKQ